MGKKIIYFANVNSPHIKRWIELSNESDNQIEIYTIHEPKKDFKNVKVEYILPFFTKKLGILKYIIAGLIMKIKLNKTSYDILHAHNSSGYGLMAYLTRKKYILTTYGSEIFDAENRGILYKTLLKKILTKADKITATTNKMEVELSEQFNINNNVYTFSLGVNSKVFSKKNILRKNNGYELNDKIWIINRRITPLYNTKTLIEAFKKIVDEYGNRNKMIVLYGDYDRSYLNEVLSVVEDKYLKNINFIDQFLSQEELANLLCISDFSISVPNSDQLSSSILESVACGTVPILSNLESYNILRNNKIGVIVEENSVENYFNIFEKTIKMNNKDYDKLVNNGLEYIKKYESDLSVKKNINKLYMEN